jgi:hypothetical protein
MCVRIVRLVLKLGYFLRAGWLLSVAASVVHGVEFLKFIAYVSVTAFMMCGMTAITVLSAVIDSPFSEDLEWTVQFFTGNIFALAMAYYHWPYDCDRERGYVAANNKQNDSFVQMMDSRSGSDT